MAILRSEVIDKCHIEEFFIFKEQDMVEKFQKEMEKAGLKIPQFEKDVKGDDDMFSKSGVDLMRDLILNTTYNFGITRFGALINFG